MGFDELPGYEPAFPPVQIEFWRSVATVPVERVLDLLAVRWAILPAAAVRAVELPVRGSALYDYALVENEHRRPRAFVAERWERHERDDDIRDILFAERGVDLGAVRLSGGSEAETGARGTPPSACAAASPRPEDVNLSCASAAGGYAVLLDTFAPGWTAAVDGVPAAIERADLLGRAVRVPPGAHRVTFRYRTPGLRAGAAVSLCAWLALAAAGVATRRRRKMPGRGRREVQDPGPS